MSNIGMIDMHSHILPNADHGCSSADMSLELVKIAKNNGVAAIAATPHFYLHRRDVASFIQKREDAYERLLEALDKNNINDIEIVKGAEVTLETGVAELETKELRGLCYENTDYILVEMPFVTWSDWVFKALEHLTSRHGLIPIIAHIERYNDPRIEELYEMTPIAQINADSVASIFSGKKMIRQLKEGTCHIMGSDLHNIKGRNYDNFITAKKKIPDDILEGMYKLSRAILDNKEI